MTCARSLTFRFREMRTTARFLGRLSSPRSSSLPTGTAAANADFSPRAVGLVLFMAAESGLAEGPGVDVGGLSHQPSNERAIFHLTA